MKNISWKNIGKLSRLLLVENQRNSWLMPCVVAVALALTGFLLNTDDLEGCVRTVKSALFGVSFYFSATFTFQNFLDQKQSKTKILFPMSSLEKYITLCLTCLFGLLDCLLINSLIIVVMVAFFYQVDMEQVVALGAAEFGLGVLAILMVGSIVVVGIISLRLQKKWKYVFGGLLILCIGVFFLAFALIDSLEEASEYTFLLTLLKGTPLLLTFLMLVLGYHLFKKVQFDK